MLPHNASDPLLFLVPTSNAQRPTWCAPRNALAKALHYCCPPSCGQCGGRGCAERPGGASSCCSDAASVRKRSCTVAEPPCVLPPEADLHKERKRLRANGRQRASKTSVSLSPGGRRDLAVALQVSGHLKSCDASKLRAHVDACRRAFAVCDVFVSTWSELKPTTIHWSGSRAVTRRRWTAAEFEPKCLRPIRELATAMRVDVQPPPDARSAREPADARYWGPERHHGWTMNVLGMRRAAELRRNNGSRTYDLAVRLRPDGVEWGPWMTPTDADRRTTYECMARLWTGASAWATAGRLAVHSCHPILALGGGTADNCFFGAPPLMDALMDELGRQRDLGGRPFRWMTVGQPELGIAHVAQAVGVPIGEQCTREVLHYMFDNESSGSRVA